MTENEFPIEKVHCNGCLHKTNHFVIAKREHSDSVNVGQREYVDPFNEEPYEEFTIDWSTSFTMLECCGCESVVLRKVHYFSEWDGVQTEYYPPPISRQLPSWHKQLPEEVRNLLKEVYTALHADSRRLAMMGARALIDIFMTEHLGDIGGFQEKLNGLEKDGYLSKVNRKVLEAALEVGHAAAHRGHEAKKEEVNQVIDIVENLIQYYALKESANNLKKVTPIRTKN